MPRWGIVLDLFGSFMVEREVMSMASSSSDSSRTTIGIMPYTKPSPTSAPLPRRLLLNSALGPLTRSLALALAAPSSEIRRGWITRYEYGVLGSSHQYALWC